MLKAKIDLANLGDVMAGDVDPDTFMLLVESVAEAGV